MKKQLLISLICLSAISTKAQNYSQMGAIGHYEYSIWPSPPGTFPKAYVTIEVVDDTVIQSKQSSILQEIIHLPTGIHTGDTYFIHATDSVVYDFDPHNNFSMGILYDYRLGAGDSLVLGNHGVTLYIDSVTSRTINGKNRIVQFITQQSLHSFLEGESIQGIGNVFYFFPTHDNDPRQGLRCYDDSFMGSYHYPGSDSCTAIITSLEELSTTEQSLELYPNPSREQLWIKDLPNSGSNSIDYTIYDAKGAIMVREYDFPIQQPVDLKGLENGLYFISLKLDGKSRVGKFVKE